MFARFFLRREFFCTDNEAPRLAPLHHGSLAARAPVVPLPRYRGGGWCKRCRSRDAPAPELCRPKPRSFCLQKNKGRRSAEKAHQPSVLCGARPRAERSALAFRRSTAALAKAVTPQLSSGPRFLELPSANGRTPPAPVQRAPRGPVIVPDERGPEAARVRSVSFRPRGPLSLHFRKHPREGVPQERDIFAFKTIRRQLSNAVAALGGVRHCKSLKHRLCCRETMDRNGVDGRCDRNRKSIGKPQRFAKGVFCTRIQ